MNHSPSSILAQHSDDALQARLALQIAAALTELADDKSHPDIEARLVFARSQALAAGRKARGAVSAAPSIIGVAGAAAVLGGDPVGDGTPWGLRLGSLVPLAVLLVGLMLIDNHYTRTQIDAAVEVDAAILADDLPPEAYRDRGFVEFLKTARP